MVFVPPLALKKEEIEVFCEHHCTIYKCGELSPRLLQVKNDG
jgi:hypothetical protein